MRRFNLLGKEADIFDVAFYLILLSMLAWFVGKVFGYINTPAWIEYFPVAGAIFGGGIFYKKVDILGETCKEMKGGLETVKCDVIKIDKRVTVIESKKK